MDPRTRMFKSLAVLAASMTATALLLAWLDPAAGPRKLAWSAQRIEGFIRSALASADRLEPQAWRGIEIVPTEGAADWRARALTAVVPDGDCHFRVAEGGRVEPLAAWREQRFEATHGAIRVVVAGAGSDSPVPSAQWLSLKVLLVELTRLAVPSERAIAENWAIFISDEPGAASPLRTLLAGEGLLG